jgi:hypothetical protein
MKLQEAIDILKPQSSSKEDIKKAYRQAAKKYHPDISKNSEEIMKLVNEAYEILLQNVNSFRVKGVSEKKNGINLDMFNEILTKLKMPGLKIEICGTWLWISGDTYNYKEYIKKAGCKWSSKKKMWYWYPHASYKKLTKRDWSIKEIRERFGSETIENSSLCLH